ncbi:chromosomal replication initiator protein DnaA [Anaerolineales bacterium HSG25]|nr:chromosomal replication initiator protein DnaA [Anaerolineales bacterium HSG25]
MNNDKIWNEVLSQLETQMTQATFDGWLKNTWLVSHNNQEVVVGTETTFVKDWLENRLFNNISRTVNNVLGHDVAIKFIVGTETPSEETTSHATNLSKKATPKKSAKVFNGPASIQVTLNPKYTFDQFVVGTSNRLAHAASLAASENPGKDYNPLFLYGGVGLGKTHLLQAIAHVAHDNGKDVIYITSETFTNDLVDAIRSQSTDSFREKYRSTDFLLIDDIQFIAGKESTQEELFHTFNTLHSAGGHIVLSSDRPPKAIHSLEDRLLSRFEWGLLADVQPPDLETRMAILRFKAEDQGIEVPNDVVEFIARRAQNNIRELEGALTKVMAHATMTRQQITMRLATIALKDIVTRRSELTVLQVLSAVAKFYRIDEKTLLGRNRTKDVSAARQMVMYLAREETDASLPQIGRALGGRDHTTIKHGLEKTAGKIETNDKLRREMLAIREMLYAEHNITFY